MSTSTQSPSNTGPRRYEAVLRISEALASCHEPNEVAKALARELSDFLPFDHLDLLIFKEGSTEIEWLASGNGAQPLPHDLPLEELPGFYAYHSQELVHTADWAKDERFPRLKQWAAAHSFAGGAAVGVPLTTPHRRLGTFGVCRNKPIAYSDEDSAKRLMVRLRDHVAEKL